MKGLGTLSRRASAQRGESTRNSSMKEEQIKNSINAQN